MAIDLEQTANTGFAWRSQWVTLVAIILISVVLVLFYSHSISSEKERLEEGAHAQLSSMLDGRIRIIDSWLESEWRKERQFSRTPALRIIAAELTGIGNSGKAEHATAIARFQQRLDLFVGNGGLDNAMLVDQEGDLILSSANSRPLPAAVVERVKKHVVSGAPVALLIEGAGEGVGYYRISPVHAIQPRAGGDDHAIIAMLVTYRVIDNWLQSYLDPGEAMASSRALYLLAKGSPGDAYTLYTRNGESVPLDGFSVGEFSRQKSLAGEAVEVYSLSRVLGDGDWVLSIEANAAIVDDTLFSYQVAGASLGGMLLILFGGGMLLLRNQHSRGLQEAMTDHYKTVAEKVEVQRRFLDGINAAMPDLLGVKNSAGKYIYVNPAMIAALHKSKEEILGQGDRQLFSMEIVERLQQLARMAMGQSQPVRDSEIFSLNEGGSFFVFGAVPLQHGDDVGEGIIVMAEDVTELHKLQLEKERSADHTIAALVATVEKKDPYLKGQTAFTSRLAGGMGGVLGLDRAQHTALNQAALLSQVGKSFIPRELSTRSERLDSEELAEVRELIGGAVESFRPLGLPDDTISALEDMYERIDGSGFPQGAREGEVSQLGRVLGVADIVTARALPRSNRSPIEVMNAVEVLAEHPERYDASIVEAARQYLQSEAGELLVEEIRQAVLS